MRKIAKLVKAGFFLCCAVMTVLGMKQGYANDLQRTRHAGVAGAFYPADPQALKAMMEPMLTQAKSAPAEGEILAAIAPHAGYPYSGPTAANVYAALRGHTYKRVVVIAPTHYDSFSFTSIYDGDAYETPLGRIPVDHEFARALAQLDPSMRLSANGHDTAAARQEHAIEVQLPWLQLALGEFQLVPIVMGSQSYESSRALGIALARLNAAHDTLILASSDLSHYHPYAEAASMDRKSLESIRSWDYFSMLRNFEQHIWEACGGAPIAAAMIAAERLGANHAQILDYRNSGDTTGDRSRVVGYGAVLFVYSTAAAAVDAPFDVSAEDRATLLALARQTVEHYVTQHKAIEPPAPASASLLQDRGAFTTLTVQGNLRGCIGYTSPLKPLYLTVRDTALLASQRDPRFRPVTAAELPTLAYEISVISPLRRVLDVAQIEVGRHGLLIKNGEREGLLLPQVPVELGWDRLTFLEQTCVKANLPSDCWKLDSTDIFAFSAVVFHESEP